MREAETEGRLKGTIRATDGEKGGGHQEGADDGHIRGIHLPAGERTGQTNMAAGAIAMHGPV